MPSPKTSEVRSYRGSDGVAEVDGPGSLLEIETQILIAQSLGYLQTEDSERLLQLSAEVSRILHGLIAALPYPSNRERRA